MEKQVEQKWMMFRAVLFNFWYYPDQEFYFENGCGVLRGHNGSGKSVTTQSLITVLLDGDVRSHKLDPFGGRERNITDTVLGEKGLVDIDQRIGYIALEFKKGDSEVYKTIGMGVDADRTKKSPKVWYFIIDGKRIGPKERNLKLYKEEIVEGVRRKFPLNEKELKMQIETKLQCGKVYSNRDDYAMMVNKHLFGFETLESYKGLIGLLLQARSPKLSDQNKPEGVVHVLNDSLPQLTNEELRPLTSSIEAIDRIEKDLEAYKQDLKGVKTLSKAYDEYNRITLIEKAIAFEKASRELENTKRKTAEARRGIARHENRLVEITSEIVKLKSELDVYKTEKANLGVEEIETVQHNKSREENKLKKLEAKLTELETKKENTESAYRSYMDEFDDCMSVAKGKERELGGFLNELKDTSQEIHFENHERFYQHFIEIKEKTGYDFHAWKQSLKHYQSFISETKKKLEEYEHSEKEVKTLNNQLGNIQMEKDEIQGSIMKEEEKHEDEVIRLTHEIGQWGSRSQMLNVPAEVIERLQSDLDDVYSDLSKEEYFSQLKNHYEEVKKQLERLILEDEHRIKILEDEMKSLESDIQLWKEKHEVEPGFVEIKKPDWEKLQQRNINYFPFYEVFEYREGVNEEEKNSIQNALYESGILSSIVVARKDEMAASSITSVLKYSSTKDKNLSEVLKVAEGFEEFHSLLLGISFEENHGGYVLSSGLYQSSFVKGKASQFDDNIYIGKASREQLRQRKISELEQEFMQKTKEKVDVEKEKLDKVQSVQMCEKEYQVFPSLNVLKDCLENILVYQQQIDRVLEPQLNKLTEEIQEKTTNMKRMMSEIKKHMDYSELSLTVASFAEELEGVQNYAECLNDISGTYKDRNSKKHEAETKKEFADSKEIDVDYYKGEITSVEITIDASKKEIKSLEQRLKELGSEDIIKRVEELSELINTIIPEKEINYIREEEQTKSKLKENKKALEENEFNIIPSQEIVVKAWEGAFSEHLRLGIIDVKPEWTIKEKAEYIVEEMGDKVGKDRSRIEKTKSHLNKVFKNQSLELPIQYDLDMTSVKSEHYPDLDIESDSLKLMSEQMTREIITMELDNQRIAPSTAMKWLEEKIEELNQNSNEKDRELFKDILINTLGDGIRRKIQYVEKWEKEMNKFMEHENLIKFRIKWVPKKVEDDKKEQELDTKVLVDALKKDSRWIDIDEISKHFRSKIKEAKRRYDNSDEVNLQQVMREVLDYRSWFEFEIYFTKKGDKEYRLNRSTYGKLSGGQRVLAMVTPVLAALYAKYLEGREDAPKIFTLDEAFSRVDEDNINVMFQYIYKLGFNYILNSQSLWGCFETVPSLNIYELSRPENRPSVTVLSYYWNGKMRKRMDETELKTLIEEKEGEKYATTT